MLVCGLRRVIVFCFFLHQHVHDFHRGIKVKDLVERTRSLVLSPDHTVLERNELGCGRLFG